MHPVPNPDARRHLLRSQYGGAIGAILLNMPSHPPHAVTCLDGYPLTKMGKGGTALGITMIASFFAASFGIIVMIFASPLLVSIASARADGNLPSCCWVFSLAARCRGVRPQRCRDDDRRLLIGVIGTDVNSGMARFTFGITELTDKIEP
jgi:TctA family transporter